MSQPTWSVSRMRTWHRCPRLHHYRYGLDLGEPPTDAQAFGSVGHVALETDLREKLGQVAPFDPLAMLPDAYERARLAALLAGYRLRWEATRWEILGVEVPFEFELGGYLVNGRMDGIVRDLADGRTWVLEHKFTGSDVSPGSTYWEKLALDVQVGVYIDGATVLGHEIAGVIYDVIAKPAHKPKRATPAGERRYTKATAKEPSRLHANQHESDETIEEFSARIYEDIASRPDDYYRRAVVVRIGDELPQLRADIIQTIQLARIAETFDVHPRNPDACFQFGSKCFFWDLCVGAADIHDRFRFPRRTRPESAALPQP